MHRPDFDLPVLLHLAPSESVEDDHKRELVEIKNDDGPRGSEAERQVKKKKNQDDQ